MNVDIITVNDAARELGVSPIWIRVLCGQGRISGARKFGPAWAIPSPVRVLPGRPRGRPRRGEAA